MSSQHGLEKTPETAHLIHVQLHLKHRHHLLEFGIMPRSSVDRFWDELENEIQVDFVLLRTLSASQNSDTPLIR